MLYDPKTNQIYTPNTNQTAVMGQKALPEAAGGGKMETAEVAAGEERANPNHDPRTGRFTSGPGGKKGKSPKYAPSPQRNKKGIQLGAKRYARLCGTLGTLRPGLEAGQKATILDTKYEYLVEADGYGGFSTLSVKKLK